MPEMIHVTPNKGARVRQPERNSNVMPTEGGWVPRDTHYEQLIAAGDVIVSDPQPAQPKSEPEKPAPAAALLEAPEKRK